MGVPRTSGPRLSPRARPSSSPRGGVPGATRSPARGRGRACSAARAAARACRCAYNRGTRHLGYRTRRAAGSPPSWRRPCARSPGTPPRVLTRGRGARWPAASRRAARRRRTRPPEPAGRRRGAARPRGRPRRLAPGSSGDTAGTGRFGSSASGPSASAGGAAAGAGATDGWAPRPAAAACFRRCARRTCSRGAIRSSWDTPRRQSAVSRRRV